MFESYNISLPVITDEDANFLRDQGYEVDYLLGNLGSTLVFIIMLPIVYLITGLFNFLGTYFSL